MVAGPGERKGCDARTDHACARGQAEFRQGRAGDPRAGDARPRPARRAHRAALRRTDVGGFLRPARPAAAGRQPGRRVGQRRRRQTAEVLVGMEAEFTETFTGARGRVRRRELDDRRGARRGEARRPARARRGRAAQLRRHDARGDQPAAHRPAVRAAVRHVAGGDRAPGPRGRPAERGAPGRQPDDRHAARQPGQVRRAPRPGPGSGCRTVRGRDPAPAGQRRRPGGRGRRWSWPCTRSRPSWT